MPWDALGVELFTAFQALAARQRFASTIDRVLDCRIDLVLYLEAL